MGTQDEQDNSRGNSNGGASRDRWQRMGIHWPKWLDARRWLGDGPDERARWLNAVPDEAAAWADELAERRRRRAGVALETEMLDRGEILPRCHDADVPDAWPMLPRPRALLGEARRDPAGWLDPGGPDLERYELDRRQDEHDDLDGAPLAAVMATVVATWAVGAGGTLDRAREITRGAVEVLDDIAAELDAAGAELGELGELGDQDDA